MAEYLSQGKCVPCSGDLPPLSEEEINSMKPQVPEWEVIKDDDEFHLERVYKFSDFKTALAFTQSVGEAAEAEGHHPVLVTEWGKVTVTWWTHAISGLHKNDFIMAAKSDDLAKSVK